MLKLYGYFRSSASYRVRIALNMKSLDYEQASIHLAKGRQYTPEFTEVSPQNLVPVLEHDDQRLYQSLAIIEYLDEKFPQPALLPKDSRGRNRVRSLALISACEIHPLNNTRVLAYLTDTLRLTDEQKSAWYAALGDGRLYRAGEAARDGKGNRAVLPRRYAGYCRHSAGAASRQRQSLQGRPRPVSHHQAHQRKLPGAGAFQKSDAAKSARRRMTPTGLQTGANSVDASTLRALHVGVMGVVRYAVSGALSWHKGLQRTHGQALARKVGNGQAVGVI